MAASIRFYATGFLLSAALVSVGVTQPGWDKILGVKRAREPYSQILLMPGRAAEVMGKRMEAKRQVIARLQTEELTLFEAAAWFRYLNHEPPEFANRSENHFPGQMEEEQLCRQVIVWMKQMMQGKATPSEIERTAACLEAELAAHLYESGRVELPSWR